MDEGDVALASVVVLSEPGETPAIIVRPGMTKYPLSTIRDGVCTSHVGVVVSAVETRTSATGVEYSKFDIADELTHKCGVTVFGSENKAELAEVEVG